MIITGASSGLGAELAKQLALTSHFNLVLFARNIEELKIVEAKCKSYNTSTLIVGGDVSRPNDCKKLIDKTIEKFESIDLLINNAGISMWTTLLETEDMDLFDRVMRVNYLGNVYCTKYALPHLIKSNGTITCISSIQAIIGAPHHTAYAASKAALNAFYDSLSMELDKSVHILTIYLGWLRGTKLRENASAASQDYSNPNAKHASSYSICVQECAKKILNAIEKKKHTATIPGYLNALRILKILSKKTLHKLIGSKMQ